MMTELYWYRVTAFQSCYSFRVKLQLGNNLYLCQFRLKLLHSVYISVFFGNSSVSEWTHWLCSYFSCTLCHSPEPSSFIYFLCLMPNQTFLQLSNPLPHPLSLSVSLSSSFPLQCIDWLEARQTIQLDNVFSCCPPLRETNTIETEQNGPVIHPHMQTLLNWAQTFCVVCNFRNFSSTQLSFSIMQAFYRPITEATSLCCCTQVS